MNVCTGYVRGWSTQVGSAETEIALQIPGFQDILVGQKAVLITGDSPPPDWPAGTRVQGKFSGRRYTVDSTPFLSRGEWYFLDDVGRAFPYAIMERVEGKTVTLRMHGERSVVNAAVRAAKQRQGVEVEEVV